MDIPHPRKGYFFIFYSAQIETYWIIPSLELIAIASQNKKGKNIGKYHINLTGNNQCKGVYTLAKLDRYRNNFDLLIT
jgi:hypothetical protein